MLVLTGVVAPNCTKWNQSSQTVLINIFHGRFKETKGTAFYQVLDFFINIIIFLWNIQTNWIVMGLQTLRTTVKFLFPLFANKPNI